jgi:Stage II sporulation protein E (SpoIIE)
MARKRTGDQAIVESPADPVRTERLDELSIRHRDSHNGPMREPTARSEPLAALVELLEGAELAPPDRLPAIAEAAGRAVGVGITMYLVDYEQQSLHPASLPGDSTRRESLDVETTLAGRAFRLGKTVPAQAADSPCLWVPLLDGVERLGVLKVEAADPADLYDSEQRTQYRWISMLLGHLVVLMTQYGDGLDILRLRRPRTVAGELIWSLLPPLTAGVDSFVVSGVIEPRYDMGGDVFDYSLSETKATLLILDAVGHDLHSGLIAAAALAAHRSARNAGRGLLEQARAIDETISQQFKSAAFATAVLAEVDLGSGRLRYLNAGHPRPLIMRGGRIVKMLTGGSRPPLGLGARNPTIAEEMLQSDDWLVLHTDGITEARDHAGETFGDARLVDFLRREAATGYPPPETARRLIAAVLAHQDNTLQDDATVLLGRWIDPRRVVP